MALSCLGCSGDDLDYVDSDVVVDGDAFDDVDDGFDDAGGCGDVDDVGGDANDDVDVDGDTDDDVSVGVGVVDDVFP